MRVEVVEGGVRLDAFAAQALEQIPSKAFAKRALKRGEILLNGAIAESSRFVKPGDVVELVETARRPPAIYERAVRILFEDQHMAVVDKPAGLPTNGVKHRTLEHTLAHNLAPSGEIDVLARPRTVHRLDFQTQGLVVCAKTGSAHMALARAFEERRVHKRYRALVTGRLDGSGQVDSPLDGRAALSRWESVDHTRSLTPGWVTTVDLWPVSGRTHQLRRHMAELGHPVLGDVVYTRGKCLKHSGLHLASVEVRLPHPVTGQELTVVRDEPPKFASVRAREHRRYRRWGVRQLLAGHAPASPIEANHLERCLALLDADGDAFARDHVDPGHFTASSFVLSPDGLDLLLIFHGKLHRWLQPGGHVDPEDDDIHAAARREVAEEVGLVDLDPIGGLFDVDVHDIPALRGEAAHAHHDLRFLFRARTRDAVAGSDAKDVRWVRLQDIREVESDASVMRAVEKLLSR